MSAHSAENDAPFGYPGTPPGFVPLDRRTRPSAENDAPVRVGFRYQDGEVLSPEREAVSRDDELPEVVLDLGDGEWLTLAELRVNPPEEGQS